MSEAVRSSVAEQVRAYRIRAGLGQQELAARAGVSIRALRNIERGLTHQPRPDSMDGLARALNLSPAEHRQLLALVDDGATGLSVAILGPLSVRRGGEQVSLAGAMSRRLLGILALTPRRAVGRAELIDLIWGEQPPRSATSLLHMHVSQLRARLEPQRPARSAATVLARSDDGYLLDLDDDRVDLARFDQRVALARRLAGAAAVDGYAEALALWRGPALADAGERLWHHPPVAAAAARRVSAVLAAVDVALAQGATAPALAWLRAVLADEPLYEGLHARLITVLGRHGETAAALRHYAAVRAQLVEELGVEPAAEMRTAYLSVLRQDGGAPADATVPNQLPPAATSFVGRAEQLATLDRVLSDRTGAQTPTTVLIAGTAGVGKTTLAVHWGHRVADRFPDGRLYLNLRGFDPTAAPMTPAEAVRVLLDALEVPAHRIPSTLDARIGLYRSLVAGKRMLLLLDNAHHTAQVRQLLPGTPSCLVLVTSRHQLTGLVATDGAQPVPLGLVSPAEARELLANRLGRDRTGAEPESVEQIIHRCARLPLALAILAARAAFRPGTPLSVLADEVADRADRLDALVGDDPTTDIRAVLSWSYQGLTPAAGRVFRLLGVHPGPDVDAYAVASLAALTLDEVRPLLAELVRASLLVEHRRGRYVLHDLLRAYAGELAAAVDPRAERERVTRRLLDHYLHHAHGAALCLEPHRDPITLGTPDPAVVLSPPTDLGAATTWLRAEYRVLLAVLRRAATTGYEIDAYHLAWTLVTFQHREGHWQEGVEAQELAASAAQRAGLRAEQAVAHRLLGRALARLGEVERADTELRTALTLFDGLSDHAGHGRTHLELANLLSSQGRYGEAIELDQRGLALFQASGRPAGEAVALNQIGWHYALAGDHRVALGYCQRALAIHQQVDSAKGAADTWDSIGYIHRSLGAFAESATAYQQALHLYRQLGSRYDEAETLISLADSQLQAGDVPAARGSLALAEAILIALDHPSAERIGARLRALDQPTVAAGAGRVAPPA